MARDLLRVDNLSAGYGDLQILWDVTLSMQEGECIAVLGSNGVGKSTLLKTIAGLLPPMKGQIIWDGEDVTALEAPARCRSGIALVPEGKRLFAGMTVKENVLMGAFTRADRDAVGRDLEWVLTVFPSLRDKLGQVAGTLSGGEQQMCAIGRGLMARPRLLMIDEVSFGLSPSLADRLLSAIGGINQAGVSIILVEQDVLSALSYAHRAYVLSVGRVVRVGTGPELTDDPIIRKNYLSL